MVGGGKGRRLPKDEEMRNPAPRTPSGHQGIFVRLLSARLALFCEREGVFLALLKPWLHEQNQFYRRLPRLFQKHCHHPMRKRGSILLSVMALAVLLGCFIAGCSESKQDGPEKAVYKKLRVDEMLIGGIQMNEWSQKKWVETLRNAKMNTLEVTVYAQQGRWFDNNLWFYSEDQGVMAEIKNAKKEGMRVVLILRLQMDHFFSENNFLWHGMVFPKDPYLVQRWFEEYGRFAEQWAKVCEEYKVDVLVIGSEMNALFTTVPGQKELPELQEYYINPEKQAAYKKKMMAYEEYLTEELLYTHDTSTYKNLEAYLDDEIECKEAWANVTAFSDSTDPIASMNLRRSVLDWYWSRLIDQLRNVYSGKMTIAANFDNYKDVRFWNKLDYIGINAYFPLRNLDSKKGQIEQFKESWSDVLDEITAFKKEIGVPNHPVLFTELGYGNHSGSTLLPWQGFGFSVMDVADHDSLIIWKNQPLDHAERNNAVRALYEVVKEKRFPLKGILYWKLTTHPHQLEYDPFALLIGQDSPDTLQKLLSRFRGLEPLLKKGPLPVAMDSLRDSTVRGK